MPQHVKILAILHIVFSALGLVAALIVLLVFGGMAGLLGVSDITLFSGLASWAACGIGLLQFKPWAGILMIVISALDLLGFPSHTALGTYGLWVLFNRETEQLFVAQAF